jgi:ribose transport system permease protein
MKSKFNLTSIIPFAVFVLFFGFFTALTGGNLITRYNLMIILQQSIPLIIGGLGMIFVIAIGSIDLSMGAAAALAGTISTIMVNKYGFIWLFPAAMLTGLLVGLFNGISVSRLKIPSFMATLSLLIGLRGLVNVLIGSQVLFATKEMLAVKNYQYLICIVLIIIMGYLFKYTRVGHLAKAIGENEIAVEHVGISFKNVKLIAFVLSGLMAGIVGIFITINVGGANQQMGNFFELRVLMAIFVGGVPVQGGMQAKLYKLIIGAPTIIIMENGLVLLGIGGEIYQAIQGAILVLLVALTMILNKRSEMRSIKAAEEALKAAETA